MPSQSLTATDNQGRKITFNWDHPEPPTEKDIDQIFAHEYPSSSNPQPSYERIQDHPSKLAAAYNTAKNLYNEAQDPSTGLGKAVQVYKGVISSYSQATSLMHAASAGWDKLRGEIESTPGGKEAMEHFDRAITPYQNYVARAKKWYESPSPAFPDRPASYFRKFTPGGLGPVSTGIQVGEKTAYDIVRGFTSPEAGAVVAATMVGVGPVMSTAFKAGGVYGAYQAVKAIPDVYRAIQGYKQNPTPENMSQVSNAFTRVGSNAAMTTALFAAPHAIGEPADKPFIMPPEVKPPEYEGPTVRRTESGALEIRPGKEGVQVGPDPNKPGSLLIDRIKPPETEPTPKPTPEPAIDIDLSSSGPPPALPRTPAYGYYEGTVPASTTYPPPAPPTSPAAIVPTGMGGYDITVPLPTPNPETAPESEPQTPEEQAFTNQVQGADNLSDLEKAFITQGLGNVDTLTSMQRAAVNEALTQGTSRMHTSDIQDQATKIYQDKLKAALQPVQAPTQTPSEPAPTSAPTSAQIPTVTAPTSAPTSAPTVAAPTAAPLEGPQERPPLSEAQTPVQIIPQGKEAEIPGIENISIPRLRELREMYTRGRLYSHVRRINRELRERGDIPAVERPVQGLKLEGSKFAAPEDSGEDSGEDFGTERGQLRVDTAGLVRLNAREKYGGNQANVAVKELLQNAHDAIKASTYKGQLKPGEGKIDITLDPKTREIVITDNGVGMTPKTVKEAFFTIAGTYKEDLPPKMRSGGFGLAKMGFMVDSKRFQLDTVRDGIRTTVDTNGDGIVNSDFNIVKTPAGPYEHGTTVRVQIPESYTDNYTGRVNNVWFPRDKDYVGAFNEPMLGSSAVRQRFIGEQGESTPFETLPIGKNFNYKATPKMTTAHFSWGDADIYMGVNHVENPSHRVLSSGVYQFEHNFELAGGAFNRESFPHDLIIDIKPNVPAQHGDYPIEQTREGFRGKVKPDIDALEGYFQRIYRSEEAGQLQKSMKTVISLPRVMPNEAPPTISAQYLEPVKQVEKVPSNILPEIKVENNKVYDTKNKVLVDMQAEKGYKSTFKPDREAPSAEEFKNVIPNDPDKPILHNNTNVDYIKIGTEAGGNPTQFFSELGSIVTNMKEAIAENLFGYDAMRKGNLFYSGVSVDKGYGGLHFKVPFKGVVVNPFYDWGATTPYGQAEAMLKTITHELAHERESEHGEMHNAAEMRVSSRFADLGLLDQNRKALTDIFTRHWDTFKAMKGEYAKSTTRNIAESIEELKKRSPGSAFRDPENQFPGESRPLSARGRSAGYKDLRTPISDIAEGKVSTGALPNVPAGSASVPANERAESQLSRITGEPPASVAERAKNLGKDWGKAGFSAARAKVGMMQHVLRQDPKTAPISDILTRCDDIKDMTFAQLAHEAAQSWKGLNLREMRQVSQVLYNYEHPDVAGPLPPKILDSARKLNNVIQKATSYLPDTDQHPLVGAVRRGFAEMKRLTDTDNELRGAIQEIWHETVRAPIKSFVDFLSSGKTRLKSEVPTKELLQHPFTSGGEGTVPQETDPRRWVPAYLESVLKAGISKPAAAEARVHLNELSEATQHERMVKNVARDYIQKFMGYDDSPTWNRITRKAVGGFLRMGARYTLGFSPRLQELHVGRLLNNIFPALGPKFSIMGVMKFMQHPIDGMREARDLGLSPNWSKPWSMKTPTEKMDQFIFLGDLGNLAARAIGYQGFLAREIARGLSGEEAKLSAIGQLKDEDQFLGPSRYTSILRNTEPFLGIPTQYAHIPAAIADQQFRILRDWRNNPGAVMRMAGAVALSIYLQKQIGVHLYHPFTEIYERGFVGAAGIKWAEHIVKDIVNGDFEDAIVRLIPGAGPVQEMLELGPFPTEEERSRYFQRRSTSSQQSSDSYDLGY